MASDGDAAAPADDDEIDGNGGFSNESELSVTAAGLSVRPRVSSSWQDTMSVVGIMWEEGDQARCIQV